MGEFLGVAQIEVGEPRRRAQQRPERAPAGVVPMQGSDGCRIPARDPRESRHGGVGVGRTGGRSDQRVAVDLQQLLELDEFGLRLSEPTEPDPREMGE